MAELEKQGATGGAAAPVTEVPPNNDELLALSDELERERCQTEQERRQLPVLTPRAKTGADLEQALSRRP